MHHCTFVFLVTVLHWQHVVLLYWTNIARTFSTFPTAKLLVATRCYYYCFFRLFGFIPSLQVLKVLLFFNEISCCIGDASTWIIGILFYHKPNICPNGESKMTPLNKINPQTNKIKPQTVVSRTQFVILATWMVNLSHVLTAVPLQATFLPALQFLQRCLTPRWDRRDTDEKNLVDNASKY